MVGTIDEPRDNEMDVEVYESKVGHYVGIEEESDEREPPEES